jgi:hypothetical protein
VRKTSMIAECLRRHAWWRLDRADEHDEGRNARSAVALLDAAAYAADLPENSSIVARLCMAGCFSDGEFRLHRPAERLVRFWHYDEIDGGPRDLLDAIAEVARPPRIPAQRDGGRSLRR